MAKSTYYFEISKKDAVAERNRVLLEEISKIFEVNKCRYGVRRVHQELINRGYQVNHKRVQRLMHKAGLIGKRPKEKYHSYKGEVGKLIEIYTTLAFNVIIYICHRILQYMQPGI